MSPATGFDATKLRSVREALKPLAVDTPPIVDPPRGRLAREVSWVRPKLVADVTFAEWTHDGLVRQASFDGLREDKEASQVKREIPRTLPTEPPHATPRARTRSSANEPIRQARSSRVRKARSPASSSASAVVAGVAITHPERVLYPEAGLSKLDIVRYYERIAPVILPYIRNRPLALVRCPSGPASHCFFQKHAAVGDIPGIETVQIEESQGVHPYVIANSVRALVGLAQMNVIELHSWGARSDRIEQPDTLVLDLDPDAGLPWARVTETAILVHKLLQELGLESFLKTTGGKGLHVVLPLSRRHSWEEVKNFAKACAEHLVGVMPDRFTTELSKAKRKGKLFIDYLRNARGALAVAPYSVRARSGATVATPLRWDELSEKLRPAEFNVAATLARIEREADPWRGYAEVRQTLTSASKKLASL